jgi:hypothetical protein
MIAVYIGESLYIFGSLALENSLVLLIAQEKQLTTFPNNLSASCQNEPQGRQLQI